jgi:hypothetical protein
MKIDLKECTFVMLGGGTGESLTFKIGEGNLQWTEHMAREYSKDRGILDTVRNADQEPLDLSFEFTWEWLRSGITTGYESPYDVLTHLGGTGTSDWTTSDDADPCAPPSIDIEVTHSVVCGTTTMQEVILFPSFRYEQLQCDAKAGSISVSGKCNVLKPTISAT